MDIEYFYHNPDDEQQIDLEIRQMEKENTIGCLISALIGFSLLFLFLALLPFFLTIIGGTIIFLAAITCYKMYLEEYILNFIWRIKKRYSK